MIELIYFDNSATTPVDPRVGEAMRLPHSTAFGNPSSLHLPGREARRLVDEARQDVASLINATSDEIVFTASGTEADNMALIGVVEAVGETDFHLITTAFEHPAILETCRYLERRGLAITYLPVSRDGLIDPASLQTALRPNTRLVSIMAANNVVGTVQPITELARLTHQHGALFHTDAVQAIGKLPFDMRTQAIDLLSLSAHKLYGPKGVGALYVRKGTPIQPLIHGGGQEGSLRSATENVAGLVGLGTAARIACSEMAEEASRLVGLRDQLVEGISAALPNSYLIGHRFRRLPGHVCLGLANQEGEAVRVLLALDEAGIAVSTGSACSASHATEPSYVLRAMGFDPVQARGSLRITLGRFNTGDEVTHFLEIFPSIAASLRPTLSHV